MPFAEIDMLELPESELLMSPQMTPAEAPGATYPTLRQWLGGAEQEFQWDGEHELSSAAAAHVERLYKAVAQLPDAADIGVVADPGLNAAFAAVVASAVQYAEDDERDEEETSSDSNNNNDNDNDNNDNNNNNSEDLAELCVLLEAIHAHLFSAGEPQRADRIVHWINSWDPRPDNATVDAVMYSTPTPYAHTQFWPYMTDLVVRGMHAAAAQSLRALKYEEAAARSPAAVALVEDLATLLDAYSGMAHTGRFAQWKLTVCELRDSAARTAAQPEDAGMVAAAHGLLRVVLGLPKTIAAHTEAWYDMYGALALYVVRDAADADYAQWFQLAAAEKGTAPALRTEQAVCDLLRGNYLRVVLAVDRLDPPTAAYVARLMERRGCFARDYADMQTPPGRLVSDYLLTRHAHACLAAPALVPVGAGLLLEVVRAPDARATLERFLPHYRSRTNDDLEWALTLCAKLRLPETAKTLYVRQAEASLAQGLVYEALAMLARCYDDSASPETAAAMRLVHEIAWDSVFLTLVLSCAPVDDPLIANVVAHRVDMEVHPVVRQCLAPYAVWAEYLAAAAAGPSPKNLSRLFHLLRFSHLPRKFAPLLFAHLLPMFASDPFTLPDLIVVVELLDAFERRLSDEGPDPDVEELYAYALESPPLLPLDWRSLLEAQRAPVPPTVPALVHLLREHIVGQVAKVYVRTAAV